MNGVTRLGARAVKEHVHALRVPIYEPGRFHDPRGSLKLVAIEKDIDVLRVSDGGLIDHRDPRGHGIPPSHRVGDASPFQGVGRSQKSASHLVHGPLHSLEDVHVGIESAHGRIVRCVGVFSQRCEARAMVVQ